MKKLLGLTLVSAFILINFNAWAQEPSTDDDKTLYALGTEIGKSLSVFELGEAELNWVMMGLKAQVQGNANESYAAFAPKIRDLAQSRRTKQGERAKAEGTAFLETEGKKPNAKTTESGLIYTELAPGQGDSPKATDKVKVHYRGTLIDGTEFDSSYKRNSPAEFPLNRVIPCWTEGVQIMKTGGKARLVCPSNIAYGERGTPGIPPNSTLIFEVELLEILPPPEPKAAPTPALPKPVTSGTPAPKAVPTVQPAQPAQPSK